MEEVQWTSSPTSGCARCAPRRDRCPAGAGWFGFPPMTRCNLLCTPAGYVAAQRTGWFDFSPQYRRTLFQCTSMGITGVVGSDNDHVEFTIK